MATADQVSIGYAPMQEFRKPYPNTRLHLMPANSFEGDHARQFSETAEFRNDGYDTPDDLVAEDGNIQFSRFFKRNAFDLHLESLLWAKWAALNSRVNDFQQVASKQITDVDSATKTITTTSGTAWVAGDLVYITGSSKTANNGLKTVATSSSDTALITVEALEDEAAPPYGMEIWKVGIALPADDLSVANDTLVSATVDFAARGFTPGRWIKVGGDAVGNQFSNAWLNEVIRIKSNADTSELQVDHITTTFRGSAAWADNDGSGKAIHLFLAEPILPGFTKSTLFWSQKEPVDSGSALITNFYDVFMTEATLSVPGRDRCEMSMQGQALGVSDDEQPDIFANASRQRVGKTMAAGYAGQRIYFDGAFKVEDAPIQSSNLKMMSGAIMQTARGYPTYAGADKGKFKLSLELQAHFNNRYLYDAYKDAAFLSYADIFTDGVGAYVFETPKLQTTGFSKPKSGTDQQVIAQIQQKATASDDLIDDGALNPFVAIHRFRYCGAVPTLLLPTAPTT